MTKNLYILDVSGYIFRAYFALPPMQSPRGEPTHGLFGFIRSVIKFYREFGPDHIVAVFDGPDNKAQRRELYEKYKSNRTRINADLPEQIEKAKEFCELIGIPTLEISGVEADDTIGSIATLARKHSWHVYICTSDKDLCQLVDDKIQVINPWKENLIIDKAKVEEIYGVPPSKIVDLLALMGDSSDNIPGVKGVGPKTATAFLQEFGSLENLFNNLDKLSDKKRKMLEESREEALLSRRLATIYQDVPIPEEPDFFLKKPPKRGELFNFYLSHGFNSLAKEFSESGPVEQENVPTRYLRVENEKALEEMIAKLTASQTVAFILIASEERACFADPVGISFSVSENEAYYLPFTGGEEERSLKALEALFKNQGIAFVTHNAKYQIIAAHNTGFEAPSVSFDLLLASYLLNAHLKKHTLEQLMLAHFAKAKTLMKALTGSGKKEIALQDVPQEQMTHYACEKVDYLFRCYKILEDQIEKRGFQELLYQIEMPLSEVLSKVEERGIFLDKQKLEELGTQVKEELAEVERAIYEIAKESFNIGSPKQLAHILFEKLGIKSTKKTATGHSTSVEVLEELSKTHPIGPPLMKYRMLEKLRSTYIDALPAEIHPKTGRIHPTFNQTGTTTGRLACQDPNLQNIPVRTAMGRRIREAFRAEKAHWSYLGADYSQMELRLLAHLSGDEKLIEAFQRGEDVHSFTASLIFNIALDKVTQEERHRAKAINFGIIYGQQSYGLSQELGITMSEAHTFIEAYFSRYPAVYSFIQETIERARKEGKTVTMTGRERAIPEIASTNAHLRAAAERLAINTPLQGSAADLIKLAMIEIEKKIKSASMKSQMVLQIHDELLFEAPDHELEELKRLVKESMEQVVALKVPLVVDLYIGKNWGEC